MEKQQDTLDINSIVIAKEDLCSDLPISAMLGKSGVPFSHRRIADNYTIMKKIYDFQVAQPRISNQERGLLYKYHFNTLENTTISQLNQELNLLKQFSISTHDVIRNDSEELLKIRVKELKFILSNKYALSSAEIYNGYKALDTYLTEITKFYSAN